MKTSNISYHYDFSPVRGCSGSFKSVRYRNSILFLIIKYLGNGKVDLIKNKNGLIDKFDFRNPRFEKSQIIYIPAKGLVLKFLDMVDREKFGKNDPL